MENTEYITPTKENIIFTAHCNAFGYIETGYYKRAEVKLPAYTTTLPTFATSLTDAITRLHEWIEDSPWIMKEYPTCNFEIFAIDGSYDEKKDRANDRLVYSITAAKARKYLNIKNY